MAWTYSDPATDDKDAVRFLVGDVDGTDPLVSDEEINYVLTQHPDTYRAASAVAELIAAKFARKVNVSGDGLSYSYSDISKNYLELSKRLEKTAKKILRQGVKPYVGGISHTERQQDDAESDLVAPYFRSHQHDNPRKGTYSEDGLAPKW